MAKRRQAYYDEDLSILEWLMAMLNPLGTAEMTPTALSLGSPALVWTLTSVLQLTNDEYWLKIVLSVFMIISEIVACVNASWFEEEVAQGVSAYAGPPVTEDNFGYQRMLPYVKMRLQRKNEERLSRAEQAKEVVGGTTKHTACFGYTLGVALIVILGNVIFLLQPSVDGDQNKSWARVTQLICGCMIGVFAHGMLVYGIVVWRWQAVRGIQSELTKLQRQK